MLIDRFDGQNAMPISPQDALRLTPDDLALIKGWSDRIDQELRTRWEKGPITVRFENKKEWDRFLRASLQKQLKEDYAAVGWVLTWDQVPRSVNAGTPYAITLKPKPKAKRKKHPAQKDFEAALKKAPSPPQGRLQTLKDVVLEKVAALGISTTTDDWPIAMAWARIGDEVHDSLVAHRMKPFLSQADENYYEGLLLTAEGMVASFIEMKEQLSSEEQETTRWGILTMPILIRNPSDPFLPGADPPYETPVEEDEDRALDPVLDENDIPF